MSTRTETLAAEAAADDATDSIASVVGTIPVRVVYMDDGAYIPELVMIEQGENAADPQDFSEAQQRKWQREISAERLRAKNEE